MGTPETAVEVDGLTKAYGSVMALKAVSFAIASGGYFVLLGPSGGGKTTLLRLIGGFIQPTGGRVLLHGRDVAGVAPDRRPTSMVFQSYALFPHMNVERNVAYGLKLQKLPKAEIGDRTRRMLDLEREHVGFQTYLRSHGGDFPALVKDLRKNLKFLGDTGASYFLYFVGEQVPDHHEYMRARG